MTKTPRKTTKASSPATATATEAKTRKPRKVAAPKPVADGGYDAKAIEVLKGMEPRKRSTTIVTAGTPAAAKRNAAKTLAEASVSMTESPKKSTRGRKPTAKTPAPTPAAEPIAKPKRIAKAAAEPVATEIAAPKAKRLAKAKPAVAVKSDAASVEAPVVKASRKPRQPKDATAEIAAPKAKRTAKPKDVVAKTESASVKAPRKPRAAKPIVEPKADLKPETAATPVVEGTKPPVTEAKSETTKAETIKPEVREEATKVPSILDNPIASAVRRVAKAFVRRVLGN